MKNYLLSSRCARQLLKMPRQFVNREELGRLIAQTSGAISMINESNYGVRSKSGFNTYTHQDEKLGTALCAVVTRPLGSSHSS